MPRFCGSRFWHYYRRRRRLRRRLFRVTFGRLLRAAVERKGVTKRKVSRALFNTHWFKVLKFRVTIGERGENASVRNHITDQQRSFAKRLLLLLEREREREKRESRRRSLFSFCGGGLKAHEKRTTAKEKRERERGASYLKAPTIIPNGIFSSLFWCASADRASFLSLSLSRARERKGR